VNMILKSGAKRVIAVEPSQAFEVLRRNILEPEKVTCLQVTGDKLPHDVSLDYVFSIGVLHHIPDPQPVVEAVFRALRPGGHFLIWLYGKEGNKPYLMFLLPLRAVAKHLPHFVLAALVWFLYYPLLLYTRLCHLLALPLKHYFSSIFEKMSPEKRRLIIYDQLNPSYAKYYTRNEAEKLLLDANFENVRVHHRHGYSWTVIGTKPQV